MGIPYHGWYSESTMRLIITLIFGASVLFILVPVVLNIVNLFKFQNKLVKTNDRYRPWFEDYIMILFFLSFICGSTFSAVELANSNLFGLRMFSMGLSKRDMMRFKQNRLWSVVVAENVPQLVIQILFLTTVEVTGFNSNTVEIMLIRRCKGPRNQKALEIQGVISAKGKTQQDIFDVLEHKQGQLLSAICDAWGLDPDLTRLVELQAVIESEMVEIARKVSVDKDAGNGSLLAASAQIV